MRSEIFWKVLITLLAFSALLIIVKSFSDLGSVELGLFERWFGVIIYGILTLVWTAIFVYFASERRRSRRGAPAYAAILVVLIIDALKTLLESLYFGLYSAGYSSGALPDRLRFILLVPATSAIPGVVNIIAAIVVLWFIKGEAFEKMYLTEKGKYDLERESLRLSLLSQVAGAISSSPDATAMLEEVVRIIREHLGCDIAYASLFSPDLKEAEIVAAEGTDAVGDRISLEGHPIGLLLKEDGSVVVGDLAKAGFHTDDASPVRSGFYVSLRLRGEVKGALAVESREINGVVADYAAVLETAARYVSEGMEKFQLWDELNGAYRDVEESRNYLISILSNMEERVSVIDKDYTIRFLNKRIMDETGTKIGEKCYRAFEGRDAPCGRNCSVDEIISKGKSGFEYIFQDDTGGPYHGHWYKVIARPLRNPDGSVSVIEVMRDITEEKRSEEALKKANEEIAAANRNLEKALQELKMTQEQLLQSEKMVALGRLISGVAHEINNPLTAVVGYSQLLLMESKDDRIKERLRRILEGAQRAAKIVQNLLAFARRSDIERREKLKINEILKGVVNLRDYDLKAKNIALDVDLGPDLPMVEGNFQQLQQVFLNLLLNAEQAITSFRNSGHISVKSSFNQKSSMVRVEVQDDGPGIPKEDIVRIFDPFFTTKEVGAGTGLGLSICYGIIKSHGGSIWVESEPGEGANFIVEIPAA